MQAAYRTDTEQSRSYLVRVAYQTVPFVYVFGCSLYVVIRGANAVCQRYPGSYWSATGSSPSILPSISCSEMC